MIPAGYMEGTQSCFPLGMLLKTIHLFIFCESNRLPNSSGLYAGTCSPDGRYAAVVSSTAHGLLV